MNTRRIGRDGSATGSLRSGGRWSPGSLSAFEGWSDASIGGSPGPTLLIVGDRDFVRLEHAALMLERFTGAQLAVLPGTNHLQVIRRTDALLALVETFLDRAR